MLFGMKDDKLFQNCTYELAEKKKETDSYLSDVF